MRLHHKHRRHYCCTRCTSELCLKVDWKKLHHSPTNIFAQATCSIAQVRLMLVPTKIFIQNTDIDSEPGLNERPPTCCHACLPCRRTYAKKITMGTRTPKVHIENNAHWKPCKFPAHKSLGLSTSHHRIAHTVPHRQPAFLVPAQALGTQVQNHYLHSGRLRM